MALLKFLAAIVLLLGLGAVSVWFYRHHPPPPAIPSTAASAAGMLRLHTVTLDRKGDSGRNHAGDDIHVHWTYTLTGVPAMDSQIVGWLGARCPKSDTGNQADSPESCAKIFIERCLANASDLPADTTMRCTLEGDTQVALDDAGLLSITQTLYADTGGAHGMPDLGFLNLDVATQHILARRDLLNISDARLQALIEQAARQMYNLDPAQSLKDAGFFDNGIAPTGNIGIRHNGLLFGYQSYEIAPYSAGQPQILVPYARLAPYVPADSPLRRLLPAAGGNRQPA
ncbi:MAG: DUF3298 domain-containing protein [Stenotrophobium sp.]